MHALIADDHQIVRLGLKLAIKQAFSDITFDEADNGITVLRYIKERKYNFIILDIHMPDSSSLQFIKMLLTLKQDLKIIILSYLPEEVFGIHYIRAGVLAYIHKKNPDEVIINAIKTVVTGKRYLTNTIKEQMEDLLLQDTPFNPFSTLSDREMEVLHYLIQGLTVAEISQKINLQQTTVSTYKTRIFEKMKTSNIIVLNELASIHNIFKSS